MKLINPARLEKIIHTISLLILTLLIVTIPASLATPAVPEAPTSDESPLTEHQTPQNKVAHSETKSEKTKTLKDKTPKGTFTFKYNRILKNFWVTSYDGNCAGCSGRTHFTDERVVYGLCAVDPEVIPPLSYFYVPGYGRCKAADKGGGLGGKRIDIGFDDVRNGWWSARYTDIYLPK